MMGFISDAVYASNQYASGSIDVVQSYDQGF